MWISDYFLLSFDFLKKTFIIKRNKLHCFSRLSLLSLRLDWSSAYVHGREMSGGIVSPTVVMAEYACNLEKKHRNLLKRKVFSRLYFIPLGKVGIL